MAGPKHDRVRELDSAEKGRQAVAIVRAGGKLDDVVAAGIYASRGSASVAIKRAMERARAEMFTEAELYRAQQLDRLESLLGFIWPKAKAGDDKAIAEARRIISDIGDLTGAKMPVQVTFGEGDIDRLLAGLDQVLHGRPAPDQGEVVDGEVIDDPGGAAAVS